MGRISRLRPTPVYVALRRDPPPPSYGVANEMARREVQRHGRRMLLRVEDPRSGAMFRCDKRGWTKGTWQMESGQFVEANEGWYKSYDNSTNLH